MRSIRILAAAAVVSAVGAFGAVPPAAAQSGNVPVVIVDFGRVYAESLAGKDAQTKLQTIATGINNELKPEADALETEQKALGPRFQGKSDEQVEAELKKDKDLSTKYNSFLQRRAALAQKSNLRQNEMEATRQKAVNDVLQAAGPDLTAVMQAKGAVAVLERASVAIASPNADITADVISRLNNRVKTVAVAKVDLTKQQQ